MKIRTVLAAAAGVGVGYVLGARAGRDKFDELKAQASRIVNDPDVRQKVADLPNQVRENLPKAQAVVSDTVKSASDKVQSAADKAQSPKSDKGSDDRTPGVPVVSQSAPGDDTAPSVTTPSAITEPPSDDAAESVIAQPTVAEPTVVVEPTVGPGPVQP